MQKMITFAVSNLTEYMEYTEKEDELIQAIRNYRKAYPNGQRNMEIYIMDLVYELMEQDN
ncbi:MAG: hypothetical protein K2I86_03810 [Prevotella sp.]|nr:hypothetical protein [Prevotella sp.]